MDAAASHQRGLPLPGGGPAHPVRPPLGRHAAFELASRPILDACESLSCSERCGWLTDDLSEHHTSIGAALRTSDAWHAVPPSIGHPGVIRSLEFDPRVERGLGSCPTSEGCLVVVGPGRPSPTCSNRAASSGESVRRGPSYPAIPRVLSADGLRRPRAPRVQARMGCTGSGCSGRGPYLSVGPRLASGALGRGPLGQGHGRHSCPSPAAGDARAQGSKICLPTGTPQCRVHSEVGNQEWFGQRRVVQPCGE